MRALVFLVAFSVCICAVLSALPSGLSVDRTDYPEMFQEWKTYYGKSYATTAEENLRFANFVMSIDRARSRNLAENSQAHGLTPFSDMSQDEFAATYLMPGNVMDFLDANAGELENNTLSASAAARMANPHGISIQPADSSRRPAPGTYAPNTVYDWQYGGKVSAVKDQKQCGSCWAFSATEQIESNYAFLHGSLPPALSPQQIVDCDRNDYGCNGGYPPNAYNYVKNVGGQETDALYPYAAVNGQCRDNGAKTVKVSGYRVVGQGNEGAMLSFLLSGGPLSICLDATSLETYQGKGAILQPNSCSPNNINHCVQITGFLTDSNGNVRAWNMRNSWGTWWGNSGYAFLQYGTNTCGVTTIPTTATVQ